MSNKYYIGKKTSKLDKSPALSPFSKVVIIVGDDEETGEQLIYEAGDDSGRTLEMNNPWGTQQMAYDILNRISGYAYRPYVADQAIVPDDSDIGDAVTMSGVYSMIVKQEVIFDPSGVSNISAPEGDETENEFGLINSNSATDRAIARKMNHINTRFTVELGKIETEIEDTERGLSSRITQTMDAITSEVTRATTAEGNLSSRITQTADAITAEVRRASGEESRIEQLADSITLSVSGTNGTTTFKLSNNSGSLSTETFDLHVKAVNVEGTITADAVKANTSITSPNIIGGRFWDISNQASLYISYGGGVGKTMYGIGEITDFYDAYFGFRGDFVNGNASFYLAGNEVMTTGFNSSFLFTEAQLYISNGLWLDSSCYGSSLSYAPSPDRGRIFFVRE